MRLFYKNLKYFFSFYKWYFSKLKKPNQYNIYFYINLIVSVIIFY